MLQVVNRNKLKVYWNCLAAITISRIHVVCWIGIQKDSRVYSLLIGYFCSKQSIYSRARSRIESRSEAFSFSELLFLKRPSGEWIRACLVLCSAHEWIKCMVYNEKVLSCRSVRFEFSPVSAIKRKTWELSVVCWGEHDPRSEGDSTNCKTNETFEMYVLFVTFRRYQTLKFHFPSSSDRKRYRNETTPSFSDG